MVHPLEIDALQDRSQPCPDQVERPTISIELAIQASAVRRRTSAWQLHNGRKTENFNK
jgi:hypothetical protein